MQPTLNIALRAARIASEQIARATERLEIIRSEQENVADFVASVCKSAESTLAANIHKANPAHKVIGLHSGEIPGEAATEGDVEWFVNPVDGLANFAKGLPWYAMTVICREKGRIEHVVVVNPITGEEFTGSRGRGAQLNGRRIRVSPLKTLAGSLMTLADEGVADGSVQYLDLYKKFSSLEIDVQNSGSVALTLAYVAAGRLDACCLLAVDTVNLEAGRLLIQEAGGLTGDLSGNAKLAEAGDFLAANPKYFKQLLQALR